MGVAIALGVAGLAGGLMGSMGQAQQAKAQHMAQTVEVNRSNFLNNLKNDKQNYASARANAMRRWNNQEIAKAATENYALQRRAIRENWKATAKERAQHQIQFMAGLESETTGRGIRGGTAEAMERQADAAFANNRQQLSKQTMNQYANARAMYDSQLSKRDFMSRADANIFMPGSTGVAPGSQSMNMIAGMLGGGASGLAAGASTQGALNDMGFSGFGLLGGK